MTVEKNFYTSEDFASNCDCTCESSFDMNLSTILRVFFIKYSLRSSYLEESSPLIECSFEIFSQKYSFGYQIRNGGSLVMSIPVLDSLEANGVTYKQVIALNDSIQTVHIAKDCGVICIAENSGRKWTLNKW